MKNSKEKRKIRKKPIIIGIISTTLLLSIYFLILTIANSFEHALQQFLQFKYWISLLVIGFGIQIVLFVYIKSIAQLRALKGVGTEVVATGTVSTASMVACCIHHLADVVPLIGISAAALFFNKYQILFMSIGIISNLIGITYMLKLMQKHNLYNKAGYFSTIMRFDMRKIMNYVIVFSVFLFSIILFKTM